MRHMYSSGVWLRGSYNFPFRLYLIDSRLSFRSAVLSNLLHVDLGVSKHIFLYSPCFS